MAAAALPWACFHASTPGSVAGTGGTGATTSSSQSSSSTGAPGSGGSTPACANVFPGTPCNTCIAAHCCSQVDACNADTQCVGCFLGQAADPSLCSKGATATTVAALTACAVQGCATTCTSTRPTCNPVTNVGCEAGSLCSADSDSNGNLTYDCYAPPPANDIALCGVCNADAGCVPGTTCFLVDNAGQCARFCCNDGDCGDGGACDPTQGLFGVGLCVVAGTLDAGPELPSCDTPAVAPSQGTCLTGFDGG